MMPADLRFPVLAAVLLMSGLAAAAESPGPAIGVFGIDLELMDTSVRPGDDFYRHVNGKWLETFQMPADKARYGVFDELRDRAEQDVRAIIVELAKASPRPGSAEQKIADLFSSWMDTETIEARSITPLEPHLDAIEAAHSTADLMKLLGDRVYPAPFSIRIDNDPDDTSRYAVWIGQGRPGMPGRDYYLLEGKRYDDYRAAYRTYVTRTFELIGDPDAAASAGAVIALETGLARVQWAPERRRIVRETTNPMSRAELEELAPGIDWSVVLAGPGLGEVEQVVVAETTAIRGISELIESQPLASWKKTLTFHLVDRNATCLPRDFDDARFEFRSRTLRGVEEERDRWKRGIELINEHLGEGVGRIYVERHFPRQKKDSMDVLVANLRKALETRLRSLAWMDEPTRAAALEKLASFEARIGYPSRWRDYSALEIVPGKLFENVLAARQFEWQRRLARLDRPVDREEWGMNAQTVNAYYNPSMNQITFPAAILQPPFFDPGADPAVNYGAIGAVIGHEIGHGFDDQGREYDETGRIRNWWTEETSTRFVASTQQLAAQYESCCPLPDACVNGRLTMGENIGDLGGLQMAYTAYRLSLGDREAPVIDGFTGDQRFFMSWAQVWRGMQRADALRNQLLTNPHSPAMVRGSVPLQNIDAWYDAFDVVEGDAMYLPPEERVRIW